MSFSSPYPAVDIPEQSLPQIVFGELAADDLRKSAIIDGASGCEVDYGQLRDLVAATADELDRSGLRPGDVVALLAPNSIEFAVLFHACGALGVAVTTVPVLAVAEDIATQLRVAGAQRIYAAPALLDTAAVGAAAAGLDPDAVLSLEFAGQARDSAPALPVAGFDPATQLMALPFSSGTTGHPKGVELTHRNLVANLCQIEERIGVGRADVVIAVLPFFHIYGMTVLLNLALKRRATLVTMPRFDLEQFLSLIQQHRVTFAFVAPPIAVALAKHPLVDQYDVSSLQEIFSGAAPLDEHLAEAVERRLEVSVRQGYGMSEMSPVSHFVGRGESSPKASVGPPVPNSENRVVAADGREIAVPSIGVSEPGELWVRGPNVMRGYIGNPEETAAVLDADGYLRTGDVVVVDVGRNITIVDRLKELIKYKGYQVPPAELEAVLLEHPDVADAAVIGVPDEDAGEIPKAFVVAQPGRVVDPEELRSFVAERVAPYKRIRLVEFIDVVPKSAAGKILRRELRARIAASTLAASR
ncbi:AMP-binding protein [Microbacterium sp. 22303]|uniref:AMP-binding protein n=1 Tax=Microbacterium sp. 22303 TaxID=3453905 RepID=UPI003F85095C